MIQPITECISNENDTLNEIVNEIAVRSIPKQVYNTYKEYPRFFITTNEVSLPVETIMNTINKYKNN